MEKNAPLPFVLGRRQLESSGHLLAVCFFGFSSASGREKTEGGRKEGRKEERKKRRKEEEEEERRRRRRKEKEKRLQ
jgi:hypothetical protein